MALECNRYNLFKANAVVALRFGVREAGVSCTGLGDGATVEVAEGTAFGPDAVAQCGTLPDDAVTMDPPLIVVEVISPSSRGIDTGCRLGGYMNLPSVQHGVVLDPVGRTARATGGSGSRRGTSTRAAGRSIRRRRRSRSAICAQGSEAGSGTR